jgi:hypothetical protein
VRFGSKRKILSSLRDLGRLRGSAALPCVRISVVGETSDGGAAACSVESMMTLEIKARNVFGGTPNTARGTRALPQIHFGFMPDELRIPCFLQSKRRLRPAVGMGGRSAGVSNGCLKKRGVVLVWVCQTYGELHNSPEA